MGDICEPACGGLVLVLVRVVLFGELLVGLLDCRVVRLTVDWTSGRASLTSAGRDRAKQLMERGGGKGRLKLTSELLVVVLGRSKHGNTHERDNEKSPCPHDSLQRTSETVKRAGSTLGGRERELDTSQTDSRRASSHPVLLPLPRPELV